MLPLSHPLRLAEDVATVDHLTRGRLEFGIGRSGLPGHYQGFNIPYTESRGRFLETLDVLRKAWTEERFSHEGQYFQFRDVCIMPKPYQKPHPPMRMAATTEETYPIVGRLGLPVFMALRTTSITDLKRFIGGYHAGWAEAGHPGRGSVGISMPVYVAETARQAREEPEASMMHFFRSISQGLKTADGASGPDGPGVRRAPSGWPRSPTTTCCASRRSSARPRWWPTGSSSCARRSASERFGVDESRRPDPPRARAHVDATLHRAGRSASAVTAVGDAARARGMCRTAAPRCRFRRKTCP